MYVYLHTEHTSEYNLYTVGFYDPSGKWQSESDHSDREEAAARVAYLNGTQGRFYTPEQIQQIQEQAYQAGTEA